MTKPSNDQALTTALVIHQHSEMVAQLEPREYHTVDPRLLHASMGMVTEAGEFQDALKKQLAFGKAPDPVNQKEELGDMMWYVHLACLAIGTTLENVLLGNFGKLRLRHGDKLNIDLAINNDKRDIEGERAAIEQAGT
jgi:NTP pyrophosphatase (non-canonical NTP hydrolase)